MLSIVPCSVQQVFFVYLFYMQECVYVNPKLLIKLHPQPLLLVTISLFPYVGESVFQDCFGYLGRVLYLCTNLKIFCSVKNAVGNLMEIALNLQILAQYGHFNSVDASSPRTQYAFLSVCIIFSFFHCILYSFQSIGLGFLRQVYSQVFYSF